MFPQSGNDSLNVGRLSFCSSCESELRSIYSIGVPSYLDESVSGMSNDLQIQDQVADDERRTMQSVSPLKMCNQDEPSTYRPFEEATNDTCKDALSSSSQIISSKLASQHTDDFSSCIANQTRADERNALTDVTMYKAQKLNYVTYKQVCSFINLGDSRKVVNDSRNVNQDEELNLSNPLKPPKQINPAFNARSLEKWKKVRDIILSKRELKIQATDDSKASIESRNVVNSEVTEAGLRNHRRNVYKLAVRVLKLSAYVRNIHEILLKKEDVNEAKICNRDIKKQIFKNEVNAIESCTKNPQDLLMYSYNPLQMKKGVRHMQ